MESDAGDMGTDEARQLIDKIVDYCSPVLVLSGGEPLLRRDWFDLARYGTERGIRVCLATNGTLVDEETCRKIQRAEIRMVSLSIDGSTPEIHDDFRQQPGAFHGVMQAVELFHRFDIPFLINSSFTKRNQIDIPNVYRLAKEIKAKAWYMFMIVPTGRAGEVEAMDELISMEDYEKILNWHYDQEMLEESLLMRPTCAPQYFRIVRERSRREGRTWKPRNLRFATGVSKGCLAGQHIALIDRFGNVKPCSYFPESAGNLKNATMKEIWEGSRLLRDLRDFERYEGKCGYCEYLRVCGGCRARARALNQGNYLAEEPFCAYVPLKKGAGSREPGARSLPADSRTGPETDGEEQEGDL